MCQRSGCQNRLLTSFVLHQEPIFKRRNSYDITLSLPLLSTIPWDIHLFLAPRKHRSHSEHTHTHTSLVHRHIRAHVSVRLRCTRAEISMLYSAFVKQTLKTRRPILLCTWFITIIWGLIILATNFCHFFATTTFASYYSYYYYYFRRSPSSIILVPLVLCLLRFALVGRLARPCHAMPKALVLKSDFD